MIHHKLFLSDVYSGLDQLDDNSIDIAITSPPYWNQRDYGIKDQIGSEDTPLEYVRKLDAVFQLMLKKMKPHGVFYLNIGDKYLNKYGNSTLGFIPYQLAEEMTKSKWLLNDIIIWFKPNHMPSSVKNRFTNSFEPVFVFSKESDNLFTKKRKSIKNYSNILKINLQPTPYNHIAVFPEKLVEELLKLTKIPEYANILDPFAGSGTTLRVIKKLELNVSGIMIEKNIDYINIIKDRCSLLGDFKEYRFEDIPFNYDYSKDNNSQLELFASDYIDMPSNNKKRGMVKICETKKDYYQLLNKFINRSIKLKHTNNSIFFIASKEFDLDLINDTASLIKRGWVIRNMIIVIENNLWYPLFFIVDDSKRFNYVFNYKNLHIKSKNEYIRNWADTNFIGFKVIDSLNKQKKTGIIKRIMEYDANGFPRYVIVEWSDKTITKEIVLGLNEDTNSNLVILNNDEFYTIKENSSLIELNKIIVDFEQSKTSDEIKSIKNGTNYNGKFLNEQRKNWGASPGARASVDDEYFSLQRLYKVDQNIIASYLNLMRQKKGLSKTQLTNLFPKNFKHTVGHWLRSDFGGSIPSPTDWYQLVDILELDSQFTNYVCKTALKFQTVKHSEFKPPRDVLDSNDIKRLKLLYAEDN